MSMHSGVIIVVLLCELNMPPTRDIIVLVKIVKGFTFIDSIQALSSSERAPPWKLLLRLQAVIGSLRYFFTKGLLEYRR